MKIWRWQKGRQQETEYEKFPLWSFRIWKWGFDAYILKYKAGTILPRHKDPVENGKHWRLNITLKGSSAFTLEETTYFNYRWHFFRPDIQDHSLIVRKETTKLSFGFVKFD